MGFRQVALQTNRSPPRSGSTYGKGPMRKEKLLPLRHLLESQQRYHVHRLPRVESWSGENVPSVAANPLPEDRFPQRRFD